MSQNALKVPTTEAEASPDSQLFRHSKRPQWGLSVLIRERPKARTYQFEGGRRRKIRKGYYELMEAVNDLGEREELIRQNLLRLAEAPANEPDREILKPVASFSDQVALFTSLYPKGFQDPKWIEDHRKIEGRVLKRHRTPMVEEARDALSSERCDTVISEGNHQDLGETIVDVLSRTDLVPISFVKALRGLEPDQVQLHVEAVVRLLHGEGEFQDRFRNYVMTLTELFDGRPTWRTATVLAGLVHPDSHTVVRRSAYLRQAAVFAPTARYSKRARAGAYGNFLTVARKTRESLSTAGHEPRDLLDVHDFIWTTLRGSALEHLGDS